MAKMSETLPPWDPQTRTWADCIEIDDLCISFERTIRVPDNESLAARPPWLDKFPLFRTDDYAHRLPTSMVEQGGIFIPMYQCEAMRINFESEKRYAIKIFVGNVNAISGEPEILDDEAVDRLMELIVVQGGWIQDYIVTPYQPWIDTMATEPGKTRPFVPMPVKSGHSVKAQMATTCVKFEITRLEIPGEEERMIRITVHALHEILEVDISNYGLLSSIAEEVSEMHGIPIHDLGMRHKGKRLEDHHRHLLVDYGIDNGSIIEVFYLQRRAPKKALKKLTKMGNIGLLDPRGDHFAEGCYTSTALSLDGDINIGAQGCARFTGLEEVNMGVRLLKLSD